MADAPKDYRYLESHEWHKQEPDGTAVGTVTSGSFAPWVGKSVAMGYVAPRYAAVGTKLLVDIRGTPTPAAVVPLPFYKRKK